MGTVASPRIAALLAELGFAPGSRSRWVTRERPRIDGLACLELAPGASRRSAAPLVPPTPCRDARGETHDAKLFAPGGGR